MEGRLQCRESVVFQHVQQCLDNPMSFHMSDNSIKLALPSFQHYPTLEKEFLHFCAAILRGS